MFLYTLYIILASIYSYRGGILASFSSSTIAVCLYPPVILQRQAVWTFWSGLKSDLGGPFLVSLVAQILDLYIIVGRTTAIYNRRDLWKYGPHIELTILNMAIYCAWPLWATYTVYV